MPEMQTAIHETLNLTQLFYLRLNGIYIVAIKICVKLVSLMILN